MQLVPSSVFCVARSFLRILKTRPVDLFGFTFIVIMSLIVYYYATYVVLPVLLEGYSPIVHFLMNFLLPKYLLVAVLSNLIAFRVRDSSIRNKMLMRPLTRPPVKQYSVVNGEGGDLRCQDVDYELKERTKCMGEHFTPTPFQDEKLWHICASCEVFVPPKAWHCHQCDTCILRRDHHCVFTMGCVGEENHCNFLGLLFYLAVGCSLSAFFSTIYNIYYLETVWWMFLVKCFIPFYSIFYDFNIITTLSGVTIFGQLTAWGIFGYYMYLAFRGQTAADWSKARSQPKPLQGPTFSYKNLKEFLGPYPFLRILNPFHSVICKSIGTKQDTEDSDKRKGL